MLSSWTGRARSWAKSAEEAELYESNARRLITLWGDGRSRLHDYSGRHWAGLVATFYLPRWRRWAEYLHECLVTNRDPDEESFTKELIEWEERWCSGSQDGERWEDRLRRATCCHCVVAHGKVRSQGRRLIRARSTRATARVMDEKRPPQRAPSSGADATSVPVLAQACKNQLDDHRLSSPTPVTTSMPSSLAHRPFRDALGIDPVTTFGENVRP